MNHNTFTVGITGASGNLGRRMLHHFVQQAKVSHQQEQIHIKCLVRSPEKLSFTTGQPITLVEGDLADGAALTEFVRDLDVCIHLASLVGFGTVGEYHQVNVTGTQALCETLSQYRPQCRLIHCSSIAVLRRHPRLTWLNTDYANSKHQADEVVRQYQRHGGMSANIIYPGLIYGPEDRQLVPALAQFLRRERVMYLTGGEQHCPAIFIDDLCALFYYVARHSDVDGRDFIGVGPQEAGMHAFIAGLARRIAAPEPKYKLPKWLLVPIALAGERLYRTWGIHRFPMISRRSVDLLSINLSPGLVGRYNRDHWRATVRMDQGLDEAVQWCTEQQLL